MKKHFFNVIAALALVCGVFAFTGCADYESDINSLNERLDELETGQIASLEEQIATLSSALEDAKTAITALEGSTSDLETAKEDLLSQIEELNKKIEENDGDIAELISQVAELEAEVARIDGLEKDLKALKETVEDIENNYLTKEEAQSTYATLKAVAELESALSGVEGRLDNLETVQLPAVRDAIEAAQKDASEALGNIDALVEALGGYSEAGTLNKIDDLDAVDSTLKANIEALNDSLKANVEALREEIASTKEEILSLVVSKEELPALVEEQIRKAIEEENGRINQAISDAIKEVTNNLMSQIEDLSDRLEDVEAAMEDLTKRIEAAEGEIDDLANRIQSLVFVPEYNDGKATVLSYTINGTPVSDNMVVTATFQVTPAALAENVINQYEDYVFAYVLPVLTRSSADIAYVASAENSSLVLKKGKRDGFVDVEITVPTKTEDGIELAPGGFAVSLYVASKEEVKAVVEGEETVVDMDAGTYVTSDYVQTYGAEATEIANAYVLYNEKAAEVKEYPAGADDFVKDVNSYEVAWSVLNRKVSLYGDNNYDDVDDGTYTLHIKLGDEYYTLEEAAEMMRAEVEEITPDYGYNPVYYDRYDMPADIAEYFELEEEDPYGLSIDMAKESAMTDVIGSYVFAFNTFSFGADSRYGAVTVLDNVGKYKVINLPITVDIAASRIDWSYDFALAHANNSENPQVPNIQPIVSTQAYVAENLGEISLADILKLTPRKTEVRLGDSDEPLSSTEAPVITFTDATAETDTTGSIGISVINYGFSSSAENVYNFSNTYYIEEYDVECTVNFTLTLGQMPGDQFVNYGKPVDIEFLLTNAANIGVDNGYTKAFKQLNQMNPEWFADEAQLTESMQAAANLTTYSTYKDGGVLYENAQHSDQSPVYTRLSIEPTNEYPEGSYIRISSSAITAVGNEFNFVTAVDTWYGVTYTFTHSGKVAAPEYGLSYIPTHLYDYGTENPYVQLDYHLNASGEAYVIDEANLRNYFEVTNIPDGFTGELTVKFEVLTQENPAEGYVNIPSINTLLVDNTNGQLEEYPIDWTTYTARDIQIRATLVASADASTTKEIEINSLDLAIRVYPLVESAGMKDADDLDYYGNNYVMDGEYIVVSREGGETININLWEYVEAYARFSNGENFIPYELGGKRHTSLVWLNDNPAMTLYGAELVFDDNIDAVSGGLRRDIGYDCNTGIVTYKAEDGEIANPIYITVEGQLNYYLDYNHVQSYPVKVMIKLQDAE